MSKSTSLTLMYMRHELHSSNGKIKMCFCLYTIGDRAWFRFGILARILRLSSCRWIRVFGCTGHTGGFIDVEKVELQRAGRLVQTGIEFILSSCCLGKKGRRKARKTDASDLTPNPQKLHNIGEQLQKLNAAIDGMGPVNDLPAVARARSRKEKNKLASRYLTSLAALPHCLHRVGSEIVFWKKKTAENPAGLRGLASPVFSLINSRQFSTMLCIYMIDLLMLFLEDMKREEYTEQNHMISVEFKFNWYRIWKYADTYLYVIVVFIVMCQKAFDSSCLSGCRCTSPLGKLS